MFGKPKRLQPDGEAAYQRKPTHYLLAIGSNISPRQHVVQSLRWMHASFLSLRVGCFYRSQAWGMDSRRTFWNGAVEVRCEDDVRTLKQQLNEWEEITGRNRQNPRCSVLDRTLDIDILWSDAQGWLCAEQQVRSTPYLASPVSSLVGEWRSLPGTRALTPVPFMFNDRLLGLRPVNLKPYANYHHAP